MTKQVQEILNQKYPTKESKNKEKEVKLSGWIDENGKWEVMPNWEKLTGELDLSEFPNLEKLDCSYNEITFLNLSKCPKLTELKCWDNQLKEIKFPTSQLKLKTFYAWNNYLTEIDWNIFNHENLVKISISNNNLRKQNIEVFSNFTSLKELYIGNDSEKRLEEGKYNRFYGYLKSLKNLTELKKLQIEVTRIKEDFEHLSGDFQIISWYKQNEMIAKTIPLERLYVIRGNVKQFLKKWGIKNSNDNNVHWYKKLFAKQEVNNLSELSKLKSPKEIDESWWTRRESIYTTQFISRSAAVAGVALTFLDYGAIGGGILGIYPFAELAVSNMEKTREDRKNKWKEFLFDADTFLDNYNELLGILSQFKESSKLKGTVNEALKSLKEKNEDFLNDGYDEDGNKEIDIEELKKNLSKFTRELNNENNKIKAIADEIKKLEDAIIKYRKFSYYGETVETKDSKQEIKNNNQKHEPQIEVNIHNK